MRSFEDDFDSEEDYPEPDEEANGHVDTIACPHCQATIYEEAEQCPHCGQYISEEDSGRSKPLWIIVGALLCLAVALSWVFW